MKKVEILSSVFTLLAMLLVLIKCNNDTGTNADTDKSGFKNEQQVTITGYSGKVLRPFISKDDKYLFFINNDNILYAEKIDDITFKFMGEVSGVKDNSYDISPALDLHNNFYFVSYRSLDSTHNATIFSGIFDNGTVTNIHKINGTIISPILRHINLDLSISGSGEILFVTNVMFEEDYVHYTTNIKFALNNKGDFDIPENMDEILSNINIPDNNESWAEISANGLELFYTQYKNMAGENLKLLYAKREQADLPFSEPIPITAPFKNDTVIVLQSPTISGDGKRLYYFKMNLHISSIFMISRD